MTFFEQPEEATVCKKCDSATVLREAGLRKTRKRLLVFDTLTRSRRPLSAQEIVDALAGLDLNRVTIYRILDQFVAGGIVYRLAAPDRVDRYCPAGKVHHPPHAHFYCTSCGRMTCLDCPYVATESLTDVECGRVDTVQVLLDGICKGCLERGRH